MINIKQEVEKKITSILQNIFLDEDGIEIEYKYVKKNRLYKTLKCYKEDDDYEFQIESRKNINKIVTSIMTNLMSIYADEVIEQNRLTPDRSSSFISEIVSIDNKLGHFLNRGEIIDSIRSN